MEIELKLLIAAEDVVAFCALPLLQQHAVGAATSQDLFSTYFDTPTLHLKQHRSALRVRKAGALWIQTYKGGGSVAAGLHQRHEWECEVAGPRIELDKLLPLVDNPAARAALELPGLAAQLEAVFATSFRRTAWQLRLPQGTEVELALDQGVVEADGRTLPICEIELELKSGQTDELLAFSQALRQAIALAPSNVSKAQRGFALRFPGKDSSL
ncbi:CYTH domain-containing protein [Herbaspirillum lusitanum]|uniref:CYTH domain-containing protein n=1 Tax=Herbaspirillum lusitanum TaxID=213312 RepID=UPI00030F7394|nr:CYTH domain-containing protein [Herbaspirillum lusitanum]